jgi:transcriptional regulator with XRE-family HTH domain
VAGISSGIAYLDRLLGGFQPGDNVVWVADAGTSLIAFIGAFLNVARSEADGTIVYVNSNYAPQTIYRRFAEGLPKGGFVHVDAFTFGKGKGDEIFREHYSQATAVRPGYESVCIQTPSDREAFDRTLASLEEKYGENARYVFDSLTGLSELWGGERAVQEFFTHHCPKLYELQAVACWILEREAHTRSFLANLSHITQVVIQLRNLEEGLCEMKLLKAEDRPSRILRESVRYRVADDQVKFLEKTPERDLRIGERIKELRSRRGLSQAELARMLDITPSALCQIEGNQVYPSLPLLVEIAQALGQGLDGLLPVGTVEGVPKRGLVVQKRKGGVAPVARRPKAVARAAVEAEPLLPESGRQNRRITPYWLRLAPGAEDTRSFFDHKGHEFGWVLTGVLKIVVDEGEVLLRKGDSIYLEDQTIRRWKNEGAGRCELLWVLA